MVTAEHLPWCPAEAAVKRPRQRKPLAPLLALLAAFALILVAAKLVPWHGQWVTVTGAAMMLCGFTPSIADKWAQKRGRGPLLPQTLRRVLLVVGVVCGFVLLASQGHPGGDCCAG
jgi:hypothetical protein